MARGRGGEEEEGEEGEGEGVQHKRLLLSGDTLSTCIDVCRTSDQHGF